MITLSQSQRSSFNSVSTSSLQAINSKKPDPFQHSQRLSQRSSLSTERSVTRSGLMAVLRSFNPHVERVRGNGTRTTTSVQQMHNGGTWELFNNGRFRFTPNGLGVFARTDLFPISGRYQINGSTLSFSGNRRSSTLTSRNFASINGSVSLRNGATLMDQRVISIMAANVNGSRFEQTIDRTVTLQMQMVRVA